MATVAAGEQSGSLAAVVEKLGIHFFKRHAVRARLTQAAFVPVFTLLSALCVFVGILVLAVPALEDFFAVAGHPIPPGTQRLFTVSAFLRSDAGWVFGIVLLVLAVAAE